MIWPVAASVGGAAAATWIVSPIVGVVALVTLLIGLAVVAVWVHASRWVVDGAAPRFGRTALVGEGLALLTDISKRFEWARRQIDQLPDMVQWKQIAAGVEAIRFDAARHAAALTATEDDWRLVAHARTGSPQAALRRRLEGDRADHLAILGGYQITADRLMQRAGDALAAARMAQRDGRRLDVPLPSGAALSARRSIEDTIERLDALAVAWRSLDGSGDLLAEHLGLSGAGENAASDRARARELRDAVEEDVIRRRGE